MHGDEHPVLGQLQVLLDVIGAEFEREVVGGNGVLRRVPRSAPVTYVQDGRVGRCLADGSRRVVRVGADEGVGIPYPLLVVAYQDGGVAARSREGCHPVVVARDDASGRERSTLFGDHTVLETPGQINDPARIGYQLPVARRTARLRQPRPASQHERSRAHASQTKEGPAALPPVPVARNAQEIYLLLNQRTFRKRGIPINLTPYVS